MAGWEGPRWSPCSGLDGASRADPSLLCPSGFGLARGARGVKCLPPAAGLDSGTRQSSLAHSSLPPSSPAVPQQPRFISTNRS